MGGIGAVVWILVGAVQIAPSSGSVAPSALTFLSRSDCEVVLRATVDVAQYSKLKCVETRTR